jgi:hypothetical protein
MNTKRAFAVVAALVFLGAAGYERSAVAQSADWKTIAQWSGAGTKDTETFRTTGREWRVSWKAKPTGSVGALSAVVHSTDGKIVSSFSSGRMDGPKQDVSYVRAPAGDHYLSISGTNAEWSIAVEQR